MLFLIIGLAYSTICPHLEISQMPCFEPSAILLDLQRHQGVSDFCMTKIILDL